MRRAPRVLTSDAVVAMIDAEVGAYVHVPFCTRICPFCPYNKVVAREDLARRYFEALHAELEAYAAELTAAYPRTPLGVVLPFRRIFAVAHKVVSAD